MKTDAPLDQLETEVLTRIRRYRERRRALQPLSVALTACAVALAGGWLTGHAQSRHKAVAGSEAALLADDVSLAPSSLLASNQ